MRRAFALLVLLVACGEDFDPYARLLTLRVLAVRSEPVAPAHDETTTFSALIYTPPGLTVDSYAWSWCPAPGSTSNGSPCLVTEKQFEALGIELPPFDLGHEPTATLKNSVDPALLEMVCASGSGQIVDLDCSLGFPAQVKLVVRAGAQEVVTIRKLHLRFRDDQPANANPTLNGLLVGVDPAMGASLPRRTRTPIRADVPLASSEPTADGRERIILSWFVETGDVDDERTSFIDGVTTLEDATANRWKPADVKDYPPSTATMYVVVRDSRDGVTWGQATVTLTEAPKP